MYFAFNDENRVMISATEPVAPNMVELVPPNEFTPETQANWLYNDGEWIHDPLPVPEHEHTVKEQLAELKKENDQLKEALDLLLSGEVQ